MPEIRVTTFHVGGDMTEHYQEPEADRRYRVLVLLNRTDRPSYMKFSCPRCKMDVAELVNTEVRALTDTIDMDNLDTGAVGIRCDGRFEGGYCRIWYYLSLNSKAKV